MSDATPPPAAEPEPPANPPPETPANATSAAEPKPPFNGLVALLSVISTVMTLWISYQQIQLQSAQVAFARSQEEMKTQLQAINLLKEQLDLRTGTEKQTTAFVKLMREGVEAMAIADDDKKASIHIALLDLIAAARVGETGEVTEQNKEDIRLFAIRLAMLSENHDAIAHIGYDRVDEWLPLAKKSSYPEARATAIRALGQMALFQDQASAARAADHTEADWVFFVLEAIMDLSRGLSSQDAATAAGVDEIAKIQSFLARRENLNLNADQQRSLDRIKQALKEARGGADPPTDPVAGKTKSIDAGVAAIEDLQQQVQDMAGPARFDDAGELLEDLLSKKKELRVQARAALARNPSFEKMAAFLQQNQDSYYAWVGIAAVLNQVNNWQSLDSASAETLVILLASQQPDIRQQALSAFSKVGNPAARDHLILACNKLLDHDQDLGKGSIDQIGTVFDLFRLWLERASDRQVQRELFRAIQNLLAKVPEDKRGDSVIEAFTDLCRPIWVDDTNITAVQMTFALDREGVVSLIGQIETETSAPFGRWLKVLQLKPMVRPSQTVEISIKTDCYIPYPDSRQSPPRNFRAKVRIEPDGFMYVQVDKHADLPYRFSQIPLEYISCAFDLNAISYQP